ncbi:MAG: Rrf2 family transcriptional regulator [Planctomycetota bacterium]|jgi:Rrf2 family nitric oxide-sensitive transcriptional repressor|nr:Rrf2 family transcriptional regulator [Planctomycetota bacterium]
MQLTRFTDYALRTLILLGSSERERWSIDEVATAFAMNHQHLSKVVHRLGQLGYVTTIRGKGGGICLAMDPLTISVGAVIRDVEPDFKLLECFDPASNTCPAGGCCALEQLMRQARNAFLKTLDDATLADVMGSGEDLRKLLGIH